MINRNKTQKPIELPRIPILLQNRRLFHQDEFSLDKMTNKSKCKDNDIDSYLKQNSMPRDLKNATIYLQFPIGKRKCSIQYPNELKIQRLNQQALFANRAACAVFRKDVRARMYKYDEDRMQSLTERNANCLPTRQLDRREHSHRRQKNSRQNENNFSIYRNENCWVQDKETRNKKKLLQTVTRWESHIENADMECSSDEILERILKQSKLPNIH